MANKPPIDQQMKVENNEDSLFLDDFANIDTPPDLDCSLSSFDKLTWNNSEEEEPLLESAPVNQFVSNYNFDIPENTSIPSFIPQQQYIISNNWSSIDQKCERDISLSFINAPEPFYHVRYLSEVTSTPVNNNVVNTIIKTKKNISGRYLKGIHSRYVTIALPSNLADHSNLFIRVTRLTVPYDNTIFVHPYPLSYSETKIKHRSPVIVDKSSIYFKINKEEIYSCSKKFPNMSLTRLKQCDLKQMDRLYLFDNNDMSHPFNGKDPKNKILQYKLNKSLLDFRLVIWSAKTLKFSDTNIFCRSYELIEFEGKEYTNHRC